MRKQSPAKTKIIAVVLLAGVLPLLVSMGAYLIIGDAKHVQEPLHEGFELAGSCIALAVAMLLFLRARHEEASQHLFWIVASLIAMGLVDGLHGVHGISLRSWQRHGSTLMGGVLFGLVWLPLPPAMIRRKGLFVLVVVGLALALGICWGSEWMPMTWDPVGLYIFPVKAANALGGLGFLAAALFFFRRYLRHPHSEDLAFASLTLVFSTASLLFGLSHTWAVDWWIWHGFRLLAYTIVLVIAYDTVVALYARISRHAQGLEGHVLERSAQLATANAALRESLERFEFANRATFNAIWDWNLRTDELSWNEYFKKLFGYQTDEIKPGIESWTKRIHPGDLDRIQTSIHSAIDSGQQSWSGQYRFRRKDGLYADVEDRGYIAHDAGGRPVRMINTMQDITERRRVEEELREAKESLEQRVLERTRELARSKQLLDETGRLARVGGWEIDLKKNTLSWTEVVYQIHEVGPEYQPALETAIGFYAPEAVPVISEAVRRAIEGGQPFDLELPLITAKQNRIWVRAIGEAYREDGEIARIGGVFQDINERKLAELEANTKSEQLRQLSKELEIIIDSIPGLVFYKDTNNRFIRVNKYMSDAYKMSKKELEGKDLNELHSREQAQAYYEDDLQVIRSRQSKLNIDERWETESGTRWVNTSKIPHVDETGKVVGIIGVSMDVTERKLAEEELKKYRDHLEELVRERTEEVSAAIKELERSNKELEQFAYVASHDLQEPLRMVSSYTQLLAQRYEGQLDDKAKKYINYAVDGAVRMQRLINDLLIYSRVGTRGKPLEQTDAHSCLGEALKNLQAAVEESRAMITNDDLPMVLADASQLVQVFQNLIANAIKFRGEVPPRIHVSARGEGREWVFSISDNGIGIDPQYKDRLFVLFQRLHTKEEYPGTGIGLVLCKKVVERHGGRIWFESEPGKGSTFLFTMRKS